ncbi:hypothetical protein ACLI4Q_18325 [Natrialbaceae archaeon A-CW1-1]
MSEREADRAQTISTYELLERSARSAIDLQREDGSFPPARNGVYDEQETPLRTTARWLTVLAEVYDHTDGEEFQRAANDAVDFLISDAVRPHGYTFEARLQGGDLCDGLVGQSGPIQSLAHAGDILDRKEAIDVAIDVFTTLPFNEDLGLWEIVETNGLKRSFDRTLNHQLLFAAAGTQLIPESGQIQDDIQDFLEQLPQIMHTHEDGVVRHYIRPPVTTVVKTVVLEPRHWPLLQNETVFHYYARSQDRRVKEIGYHTTVLGALSRIKRNLPNHSVWEQQPIKSALQFTNTSQYKKQIREQYSPYGSMLTGIGFARILDAFEGAPVQRLQKWVQLDIDRTYDPETGLLTKDAADPIFQSSCVNSLVELPEILIQLPTESNNRTY